MHHHQPLPHRIGWTDLHPFFLPSSFYVDRISRRQRCFHYRQALPVPACKIPLVLQRKLLATPPCPDLGALTHHTTILVPGIHTSGHWADARNSCFRVASLTALVVNVV